MELAKIITRGQITIPIEIWRKLGVKDGDKVIFIEEMGLFIIEKGGHDRPEKPPGAFADEARRLVLEKKQDVADMVKCIHHEIRDNSNARHGWHKPVDVRAFI